MSTLVTGGSGWVGSALLPRLNSPRVLTRHAARAARAPGLRDIPLVQANLTHQPVSAGLLEGVTSVVHLAGESLAGGRWNEAKKRALRESRVTATAHLVESLLQTDPLPEVAVCASAVGYYGDQGEQWCSEETPAGHDFLADLCVDWEHQAQPLVEAGVRVVWLRFGIILGADGGALGQMIKPFRMGLGGRLGNGRQWMPWVALDDVVRLVMFALHTPALQGPVNAVSPNPVRNADFTRALGRALGRPAILPVPGWALSLAIGEFGQYLLHSQRVRSARLNEVGFEFGSPEIQMTLDQIAGKRA